MSSRRIRIGVLACLAAALAATGGAAVAETLQDAWRMAADGDRSLAAAGLDVDAARASERAAHDARWPSLSATGGYTRLNAAPELAVVSPSFTFDSGPIFRNNQIVTGSVQVKLPLYAGGQISAGIDAARQSVTGASEAQSATVSTVKLEVAQAYVDVLRAQHALRTATQSEQSLRAHVADVQRMVEGQSVAMSDLLAARVALANAEQQRVRADSAVQVALAAYNRRLGQPLDRPVQLEESIPCDPSLAALPIDTLVQRAIQARSELKSASAQADALAAQARAEIGKLRPQVALTGGYTHVDNQILNRQDFSTIGVGVSWNLFDGGQTRNRADALNTASRAQRTRLEDLRSQIELQVRQSWLGVQEAQARFKASREAVAQAEENLRMSRELYGVGMGTNTQVLEAIALQSGAASNHDDATLDVSLALLRLAHAVGAL